MKRRALLCLLVLAVLMLGCSHEDVITGPDEVEVSNPIADKSYRGLPAVRVRQWDFTDSTYTLTTTTDGQVTGVSHGTYEIYKLTTTDPPAWAGIRGAFTDGD